MGDSRRLSLKLLQCDVADGSASPNQASGIGKVDGSRTAGPPVHASDHCVLGTIPCRKRRRWRSGSCSIGGPWGCRRRDLAAELDVDPGALARRGSAEREPSGALLESVTRFLGDDTERLTRVRSAR
jgi:hypothetical protein